MREVSVGSALTEDNGQADVEHRNGHEKRVEPVVQHACIVMGQRGALRSTPPDVVDTSAPPQKPHLGNSAAPAGCTKSRGTENLACS